MQKLLGLHFCIPKHFNNITGVTGKPLPAPPTLPLPLPFSLYIPYILYILLVSFSNMEYGGLLVTSGFALISLNVGGYGLGNSGGYGRLKKTQY